jgi:dolichol-phosphate mannosyltransferase
MVSIVLPTYNEGANIQQTLRRAAAALRRAGEEFELIVVDDASPDKTATIAEQLQSEVPVRVLRRAGRFGLATAVVDGWKLARGDVLGVMDADLQHPPEVLASLAAALQEPTVDLVIASRRVPGGQMGPMPWFRQMASMGSAALAAFLLPEAVRGVRDPMSGMFLIRTKSLHAVRLDPTGYKILLEILAKAHCQKIVEVPYTFNSRGAGSSKLGAKQALQYLEHLWRLARSTGRLRSWLRRRPSTARAGRSSPRSHDEGGDSC